MIAKAKAEDDVIVDALLLVALAKPLLLAFGVDDDPASAGPWVPLIAEPKVTWHVLDAHRGPKYLINNNYLNKCLGAIHLNKTSIRAGATVAHLSFYAAEIMGCDPIIFIGQDLSYPSNITHIHGTPIDEVGQFQDLKEKGMLKKIEDIYGNEVYTDAQMFGYLQQFEKDFYGSPAKIINATEGGALKENTELMTFRGAIDKHLIREIPKELYSFPDEAKMEISKWHEAIAEIDKCAGEVKEALEFFESSLGVLKEVKENLENPGKMNLLVVKVDAMRRDLKKYSTINSLVVQYFQGAEVRKIMFDKKIAEEENTGIELQRRKLERDVEYFGDLVAGARKLNNLLLTARERIAEYFIRN